MSLVSVGVWNVHCSFPSDTHAQLLAPPLDHFSTLSPPWAGAVGGRAACMTCLLPRGV